ncbi:MAG: hypothetical protein JRH20_32205 [Deltaproteobacteria bacterium]|nr:hypothetical protein [Deltaproteobacteria bacterium]
MPDTSVEAGQSLPDSFDGALAVDIAPDQGPAGLELAVAGDYPSRPAVAFNGASYLVVWYESVLNAPDPHLIRAQRVSALGDLLGPSILIAGMNASGGIYDPDVVSDGDGFLVVWRGEEWGGDAAIRAQRISSGGLLTGAPITVSISPENKYEPAVAFGDGVYAVVWREQVSLYYVMGQLVGVDGTLVGTKSQVSTDNGYGISVASGASNFLISWYYGSGVYGRMLSSAGTLGGGVLTINNADGTSQAPEVVFDGTNFLVNWQDYRNASISQFDVYGQRVSEVGVLVGSTAGVNVAVSKAAGHQLFPRPMHCGGRYHVLFRDGRNTPQQVIYRQAITTDGVLEGALVDENTHFYTGEGAVIHLDVACGGSSALAVWTEELLGKQRVMGLVFTP